MKKITLFIAFFSFTISLYGQNVYKKWYWADGRILNVDSIGVGSINDVRTFTKLDYLCVDVNSTKDGDLVLYKPLSHEAVLIYTTNEETLKNMINWFRKSPYFNTYNFKSDFNDLVEKVHANKGYIEYLFGKPTNVSHNEYNGETYEYSNYGFNLKFISGTLFSFSKYKKEEYLSILILKYGKARGVDIYYGTVSVGMTKNMVIQALGAPYKTNRITLASGTREQWIYKKPYGNDYEFNYYYFVNNKLIAIQD